MPSPNLLCTEDSNILESDDDLMDTSETDRPASGEEELDEESIAVFLGLEGEFSPDEGYLAYMRSSPIDDAARKAAAKWILQVSWEYGFMPLTSYLAVNYMDRFMSLHEFPEGYCWQKQLMCVACLSLAMKVEDMPTSPYNLQVSAPRFRFERNTILQMELIVLQKLGWKLRSVTPFNFIESFNRKADPSRRFTRTLVNRSSQLILSTTLVADFVEFRPSSIAAAAVLCSAGEIAGLPQVDHASAASWCAGMNMESVSNCCRLMHQKLIGVPEIELEFEAAEAESPVTVLRLDRGSSEDPSETSDTSSEKRRRLQ